MRYPYSSQEAHPVEADLAAVQKYVPGIVATCLGNNQVPLEHEADQVAEAVLSIARIGSVRERINTTNGRRLAERAVQPGRKACPRGGGRGEAALAIPLGRSVT